MPHRWAESGIWGGHPFTSRLASHRPRYGRRGVPHPGGGSPMRVVATVVGLGLLLAGASSLAQDKKDAKFDPAAMVGKWEYVSGVKSGTKVDEAELKKGKIEITKDMIVLGGEATFKFKYSLDTKADPVKIDMEMTESPFGAGMKAPGIVKMEKGQLVL